MSTRRRIPQGDFAFSLFDEMRASPTEPMPAGERQLNVARAREHLGHLTYGADPNRQNWKVLAVIGNFFQAMLDQKLIQDPDNLLGAAKAVLLASSNYAADHGVMVRLSPPEAAVIENLISAYDDVLAALPHRDFIRAVRAADKRMRQRLPGDYDANPAKRRKKE